jgi:hypothetical protein
MTKARPGLFGGTMETTAPSTDLRTGVTTKAYDTEGTPIAGSEGGADSSQRAVDAGKRLSETAAQMAQNKSRIGQSRLEMLQGAGGFQYADDPRVKNVLDFEQKQDENAAAQAEKTRLAEDANKYKSADDARAEKQLAETERHNRIEEALQHGRGTGTMGAQSPDSFKNVMAARKEFNDLSEIKTLKTVMPNYQKAEEVFTRYRAGKASPYEVDQALGYFASKALDPNSVVMPGEFDRFAKGIGITGGVEALVKQAAGGGLKLTDSQRQDMFNIVKGSIGVAKNNAKEQYGYYKGLADEYGVDGNKIVGGASYLFDEKRTMTNEKPAQPAAPSTITTRSKRNVTVTEIK